MYLDQPLFFLCYNIVPGEVTALNVTAVADTILYVSWSEPLITNGIIRFYNVIIETVTAIVDNTSVNSLDVTINVLSKCILQRDLTYILI